MRNGLRLALIVVLAKVSLPLVLILALIGDYQLRAPQASPLANNDIPPVAFDAYRRAGTTCGHITWPVLAGIGKVESDHGRHGETVLLPNGDTTPPILGPMLDGSGAGGNTTPMPVGPWSGRWGLGTRWQQALGPMQFLPATFEQYAATPTANPHNIGDAAQAAANLLCDGATTDIADNLRRYNHSTAYVDEVLHWAAL